MKKYIPIFILCMMMGMFSCTESSEIDADTNTNEITTRAKPTKVTICHYNSGNNTYQTRTVNAKHLDKHIPAHEKDYSGPCTDEVICDMECAFCKYLGLMDFDEPCPENPFNYGDNLCTHYIPDPACPENPNYGSWEYTLWDRDKDRNEVEICGTDTENDYGAASVFWEKKCDGSFFGQVSAFYDADGDGTFEVDVLDFGATEAHYHKALYCKTFLESIVRDLGLTDACGE